LGGFTTLQPRPNPARNAPQPAARPAQTPAAPAVAPPTPEVTYTRAHLSAYAKEFRAEAKEGRALLPLELQRAEGKFTTSGNIAKVPEDGYYILLWECSVAESEGGAALQLGINGNDVTLSHQLNPGYESGQQITWLNAGDQIGLWLTGPEQAAASFASAALTTIRLG
jgi:hypothetical protein